MSNTLTQENEPSRSSSSIEGCRFCNEPLRHSFADLGTSPLCQSFLDREELNQMEPFYPLHAFVCDKCFLVQVNEYVDGDDIFGGEYAYFSSYSDSWLEHSRQYVKMITNRLALGPASQVIELASNDGYLLKNFVEKGITCLGVEPAPNCAEVAKEKGVPTHVAFFGVETAKELRERGCSADLILGNNVLAHVPDTNDFVGGIKILLKESGVNTMEFPHLMRLMERNQFDTIYQEHYCYLSLLTVEQIFAAHGLVVFDVEELPTHGGSIRIYTRHAEDESKPVSANVHRIREQELSLGLGCVETYTSFQNQVEKVKNDFVSFLLEAKQAGKRLAAYGAPGKATTLLNYCGVREDLISFTVDRNPYKHGRFMPGTRIPVKPVDSIDSFAPDYIVILPWNLRDEIVKQLDYCRKWGAKFVVPIPELEIIE
ncbi:MAG: class I SAM-dependent methyltransferase [Planctomycetota bacterium]